MNATAPKLSREDTLKNPAYRTCNACAEPVHHRSATCKVCHAPSPWKGEKPATDASALPPTVAELAANAVANAPAAPVPLTVVTSSATVVESIIERAPLAKDFLNTPTDDVTLPPAVVLPPVTDPVDEENASHVFMAKFSTQIGNVMCHFKQGQIVEDFILIEQLRALNAPIIPAVAHKGMVCCPNCKTIFAANAATPARSRG